MDNKETKERVWKKPVSLHRYKRKLNEAQVRDIRKCEKTQVEYGKEYGISHAQVSRIQDGLAYKWVE